jgi:hypothetical protein
MKQLHTEILIDATPETVWVTLMDFAAYPSWNPFIVRMEGKPEVGSKLNARLELPEGMGSDLTPMVTAVEANRSFEWLGVVGFKGIFDGRHQFTIEATANGTKFTQSEQFTGILAPLLMRMIGAKTQAGFGLMNQAIKERAEQVAVKKG